MKKLLISLVALAALSGAAYASDYGNNGYNGSYIRKSADSSALVVVKKNKKKLTAFERMNLISQENEHGRGATATITAARVSFTFMQNSGRAVTPRPGRRISLAFWNFFGCNPFCSHARIQCEGVCHEENHFRLGFCRRFGRGAFPSRPRLIPM